MVKWRKGELTFYKLMNPTELSEYAMKFPENTEYVRHFLKKYEYNWFKRNWKKGRTI